MAESLLSTIVQKTLRVPLLEGPSGDSAAAVRQLDIALMSVGFKLSGDLVEHLSRSDPQLVAEAGAKVLKAVRELVGGHVDHNVYFIDFPANVPDTMEFWSNCIRHALLDPVRADGIALQLSTGIVNLLDLPKYGRYQHTFEAMLAAHEELIPLATDRLTVLGLGGTLEEESREVYLALVGGAVPLGESDMRLLRELAERYVSGGLPDSIPVRETRAVINRARLAAGERLLVDTPVDVLRLACAISEGDVSLSTPTRFRSFRRSERRSLIGALDGVVRADARKLADVPRFAEEFKRLGERLHPHEYTSAGAAQDVFRVARGQLDALSLAARVEIAIATGDVRRAISLLSSAPGALLRSIDRLARLASDTDTETLLEATRTAAPRVSARVLLSLREHLQNRERPHAARMFVNQRGRAWVTPDFRPPLGPSVVAGLTAILDEQIAARLPTAEHLVLDPHVGQLAIPLSDKTKPGGFGVLPRGSITEASEHVRFFIYWKEHEQRTDYDLSVLLLDEHFNYVDQVSWTNLQTVGAVHSGDITEAAHGASEFIDLDLSRVEARYVIPQVHVYAGESFDQANEAFFGYMERHASQQGLPFEPRTVAMKSDLLGTGRVALPLAFGKDDASAWQAKWLHLNLRGHPRFNQVEANQISTSKVIQAIMEREFLQISYVTGLMRKRARSCDDWPVDLDGPVTFVGIERPENLPAGSDIYTMQNLFAMFGPPPATPDTPPG